MCAALSFVVKPDGGVVAAWGDTRTTPASTYRSQCEAGITGVTRCAVSEAWSDQSGAGSAPTLAATSSRVFLAWRDDTTGGGDIRLRVQTPS
jgi:hypothetical protein